MIIPLLIQDKLLILARTNKKRKENEMDITKLKNPLNIKLHEPIKNQKKYLELFFKNNLVENYEQEIFYLQKIKKMVYVDKKRRICFLGFNKNGELNYVQNFSVYTSNNFFIQLGEKIGILLEGRNPKTLFITESFTDVLHYKTLYKEKIKNMSFLSIGKSGGLKSVITHRLDQFQPYEKIIISFDKNKRGQRITELLEASLKLFYPEKEIAIEQPKYNSWFLDLKEVTPLRTHITQKELL